MLVYRMEMEGGHKFGPFTMGDIGSLSEWWSYHLSDRFPNLFHDGLRFLDIPNIDEWVTGVSTPEAFDEWFPPTLAEELESRGFRKMIYDAKDFIVGKKTGTQVLFDPATAKLITE